MKTYSRATPYFSVLKEKELLTGPSSSKKTYHLVLDTSNWDGDYKVGDSIGILPANDPKEVDLILQAVRAEGGEEVFDRRSDTRMTIREFLTYKANLGRVNRSFFSLLEERGLGTVETLLQKEAEDSRTLCEWLRLFPLTPVEIATLAMPLLPRFYSIASSKNVFKDEIHLVVGYVHYHAKGQERFGVGSRFLCDLAEIGTTPIPWYVQSANHFTLPQDPEKSMIMVGAGTGIAPYRAFMQERLFSQATGRNWLFFGERNRASDFYYESFWTELEKQSRLRLDAVFSRDGAAKTYVQHQMYERRKSLWDYIQDGALFYVCGDASQMAKDVEATLLQIIKEEGAKSEDEAREYLKTMRREKRYLADVY